MPVHAGERRVNQHHFWRGRRFFFVQTVVDITEAQWLEFARFVEAALDEAAVPGGEPLPLGYETVKSALGFSGKVDFYLALWQFHQRREPRPRFWFHGCHRPGQLPETFMVYRRLSA